MSALIEVRSVRKAFSLVQALDSVGLSIARGEIFGLLGPNGAGKSTLMSILSGVLVPDAGEVRVGGEQARPGAIGWRRRLGLVPQQVAVYPTLTAEANLQIFGSLYGLSRAALRQRGEALLRSVGLWERRKDRVKDFSGGMQRGDLFR